MTVLRVGSECRTRRRVCAQDVGCWKQRHCTWSRLSVCVCVEGHSDGCKLIVKRRRCFINVYDYDWRFHCGICDLPCSSERGIKLQQATSHKQDKLQNFKDSLADNAVKVKVSKLVKQQEDRTVIWCGGVRSSIRECVSFQIPWHGVLPRCETKSWD